MFLELYSTAIVTYKIYIKKDYKAVVYSVPDWWGFDRIRPWLLGAGVAMSAGFAAPMISPQQWATYAARGESELHAATASRPDGTDTRIASEPADPVPQILPAPASPAPPEAPAWTTVKVTEGDNLSSIFLRLGLRPTALDAVLSSTSEATRLNRLFPGQSLEFRIADEELLALRYLPNSKDVLEFKRDGDKFVGSLDSATLDRRLRRAEAEISTSLFIAGQDAGMSDRLIMELAAIFGWDIDFALEIWEGDSFRVIYEEYYRDGVKVEEGRILAAEFVNRGKTHRAVRYTSPDGDTDYYSESGASLRTAFLRTPLNFTRISSGFNPQRHHPILNRIRAHHGVDYAAPTGTAIRATGDGKVVYIGRKGGYGNTIILRHGSVYSTVYAHLSRYAHGLAHGTRVRQGEIIGYVGTTGLATGPHLHYEFQVNGAHKNPLTIPLPRAAGIPENQLSQFMSATAPLLAGLNAGAPPVQPILVMRDEIEAIPVAP